MRFAFLVAWREYAENARTKGFWIGIFVLPVILFLSIQAPIWLEEKGTPVRHFVLVDQSGSFAPVVQSAMERAHQKRVLEALKEVLAEELDHPVVDFGPASSNRRVQPTCRRCLYRAGRGGVFPGPGQAQGKAWRSGIRCAAEAFQPARLPDGIDPEADLDSIAAELKPYLRGQKKIESSGQPIELSAAILIPRNIENQVVRPEASSAQAQAKAGGVTNRGIQYWSVNASDPRLREQIERAINEEVRRREYVSRGMNLAAVRQVEQTYAPLVSLNPKKEKGKETVGQSDIIRQWAPSGFVYLLWLAIFVIIQMLLNNTIEEKSNRIIEVLLSSVTPGELMMGKLFGIAAVGLTMVGAWMAALFAILSWKSGGASALAGHLLVLLKGSNLLPMFSLYFLMGYLMYAAFILSIGSVCNTIKEAQSYMSVLTMVMMVPLLTMTFIPKDPNGLLARTLSWIPIYTPFTMMNRAGADPPLVDLVGTFVLLLVTTVAALWMAGKIFRIGILRTGQPPRIVEMLRWVRRKDV